MGAIRLPRLHSLHLVPAYASISHSCQDDRQGSSSGKTHADKHGHQGGNLDTGDPTKSAEKEYQTNNKDRKSSRKGKDKYACRCNHAVEYLPALFGIAQCSISIAGPLVVRLPHSGHTPLTLPVRLYPHFTHRPFLHLQYRHTGPRMNAMVG